MPRSERVKPCAPWRRGFAPGGTVQRVRPKERKDYVLNPHKGTTTFQRFNGDPLYEGNIWDDHVGPLTFPAPKGSLHNARYPDTTIAYCRWIWAVLEPTPGQYRWDVVEGALEAARRRGQTLQLLMQPHVDDDMPEWYWELGGTRERRLGPHGYRPPDYNDPLYVKHWGNFIRACGARFDGHPNLESFDLGYAGGCGETGGNSTRETAEKLADIYLRAFKKTQLLIMLGTHGGTYAARRRPGQIGWRVNCLGDLTSDGLGRVPDGLRWNHMYDAYAMSVVKAGMQEAWKTAPVTLETCWTVGYWFEQGWDLDWILEQALLYRPSIFMPKSCYIPEEWAEKITDFNNRIGYRFVLRQLHLPLEVKPGQRFKIEVSIDNMGVAPIYRPYRYAYRFRQEGQEEIITSTQDIRTWLPGKVWFEDRLTAPSLLKPGRSAKLDVGLIDDSNQAKVKFAIEGVRQDGWHPMTMIDIVR